MVLSNNTWIRLFLWQNLIFSILLTSSSCFRSGDSPSSISIRWEKNRATGMIIPRNFLALTPEDSIKSLLEIHLVKEKNQPAILGKWSITDESVLFEPVIPFTRGLTYEIRLGKQSLGEVQIPSADPTDASAVVSVYPTADTLPHNLLKMYIQFSKPMQEGQALQHILLIRNGSDTVRSVFLELQPELWNASRTMLTLWLDPGRIKRDLQPNKRMGEPLQQGSRYQLLIQQDWQDTNGASLVKTYQKDFVVVQRDTLSPDLNLWTIHVPKAGSTQPLQVDFHESLDYVLLNHTVRIVDHKGNSVEGVVKICSKETTLNFIPSSPWKSGSYLLACEARLEDLAGNNLNRLFDRDINLVKSGAAKEVFKRDFHVQ